MKHFLCAMIAATSIALLPVAGVAAPAWELPDLDGKPVKSESFEGKVVILDFWATWCPPCVKVIPALVELQKEYGEQGLVVIGVSLDQAGPEVVREFIKKMDVNYTVLMGDEKIVEAFGGIEGIPTAFIIDREGNVVAKHVGYRPKSVFEDEIKPLL